MTVVLVALGAAIGAPTRFAVAHLLDRRWPVGTLVVNLLGATVLGAAVGLGPSAHALALVGTGFCGGLTTYSAFAVQTHALGRRGTWYAVATLAGSLAACAAAYALSSRL